MCVFVFVCIVTLNIRIHRCGAGYYPGTVRVVITRPDREAPSNVSCYDEHATTTYTVTADAVNPVVTCRRTLRMRSTHAGPCAVRDGGPAADASTVVAAHTSVSVPATSPASAVVSAVDAAGPVCGTCGGMDVVVCAMQTMTSDAAAFHVRSELTAVEV